jgi:FG-GAP-like repeat
VDLNADGHADLLSGSYSRTNEQPMAGLLQVLYGQADGTFKKAAVLKGTDDKPLIIPSKGEDDIIESICTRPTAVDWDSDGDLDLVVGNFAGRFHLFRGEGGGKFAPATELLKAGDEPLLVNGHHGDPCIADWDNDGDLDIVSGSGSGGVFLSENTAGAKKTPALKQFKPLIDAPKEALGECRPHEYVVPDGATRVCVADVNGDKKLDVLVGDTINHVSPADGVSEADFVKRYREWKDAQAALLKETEGVTDEDKLAPIYEKMSQHRRKRADFMKEDMTGFVWVYVQK